jgi:hypothetical protein
MGLNALVQEILGNFKPGLSFHPLPIIATAINRDDMSKKYGVGALVLPDRHTDIVEYKHRL